MRRHAAVRQTPRRGGTSYPRAAVSHSPDPGSRHSRSAPRWGQYSLHNPASPPPNAPLMELCCADGLESLYSTRLNPSQPPTILEAVVHPSFDRYARKSLSALLCAAAVFAAGCHHNNFNSGFGIGWVTLSGTPGDFTGYTVNVQSVALTGTTNGAITPVQAVETVDFTKLSDISELWSSASIPNDTYTGASIVLDYTNANISVMVNGVPKKAKVVDATGAAVTTQTINVTLDPSHPLTITPTFASTSAQRLAIDFDL